MTAVLPIGSSEHSWARTRHKRRSNHLHDSTLPSELPAELDPSVTATSPDEAGSDHAQGQSGVRSHDPDDTELDACVRAALSRGPSPLRSVGVVVAAGRVILHGRVPSFYLKQVAQEAVRRVLSAGAFENRLVVNRAGVRCSSVVDGVD